MTPRETLTTPEPTSPPRPATYRLMLNISKDMFESVDLSSADYTGQPITREVKAKPSIGADEYEVSYENNLNAGTATIPRHWQGQARRHA